VAAAETRTLTVACADALAAAALLAWVTAAVADAARAADDIVPFRERNLSRSDAASVKAAAAAAEAAEAAWVNSALAAADAAAQPPRGPWAGIYTGADADAELAEAERASAWACRPLSPLPLPLAAPVAAPSRSPADLNAWAAAAIADAVQPSSPNEADAETGLWSASFDALDPADHLASSADVPGNRASAEDDHGHGDGAFYDAADAARRLDHVTIDFEGLRRKAALSAADLKASEVARSVGPGGPPRPPSPLGGFASMVGLDPSEDGLGWFSLNRDLM
jgi:hypothetical protein